MKKEQKKRKAFSIVEVLLAGALFSLVVLTLSGAIIYGRESTQLAGMRARAAFLAEEGIEATRSIRDENFDNLVDGTYGIVVSGDNWTFSGSSDVTESFFTRQITISSISTNVKQITSDVTWQQNAQRQGVVSLTTYLTKWQELKEPMLCDWSTIQTIGNYNYPGNYDGIKIQTQNGYAFSVIDSGGTYNFAIHDVIDPYTPTVVASLSIPSDLTNIATDGNYAYISSADNSNELRIIDIQNPLSPSQVGTFDATGSADANGVFVVDDNVYLVREGGSDDEFLIIDVSDRTNPSLSGSVSLGGNGEGGNELYVSGDYAFVSSPDSTRNLKIVDISDSDNPAYLATSGYDVASNKDALTITGFDDTIILGSSDGHLYFIDVSNPEAVDQTSEISNYDIGDIINDISVGDNNGVRNAAVFVTSNANVNEELQLVDISDINNPISLSNLEFGLKLNGAAFDSNYCSIFIVGAANASNEEFYSIIAGDNTAPAAIANLALSNPTNNSIQLSWTAPGDDGTNGIATSYDVRYSTSIITEGNWAAATEASGEPSPSVAGTSQSMTVSGLSPSTTYYFAMKTSDEIPNISTISNVSNLATTSAGDITPPSAVSNLATSGATLNSINLSWTSPGDDGAIGTATTYDIRYSTSTITEGNWAAATQVSGEPAPLVAGSSQSMTISGLNSFTTYYFAIKTSDEVPNTSAISNVPNLATLGTEANYLAVNTAGATRTGNTITGITLQNSGPSNITIATMTVSWIGVPANRRITSISINGSSVWTGSNASGILENITDTAIISGAAAVPMILGYNNTINNIVVSILFTMSDGSTKTVSGIGPL